MNDFILIFGMCPSSQMYDPIKGNPSINRLDHWIDSLDIRRDVIFHNVIEHHIANPKIKDVYLERVAGYSQCASKILALGNFVSNVLTKLGIDHFKLPHPSPRNRKFNDPLFEDKILKLCYNYLYET
jgi:hypothetical protein